MLDRHPPVGKVAAHLAAPDWPPEADIVDHSRVIGRCRLFLHLEDSLNGGINAAMAFKGVPIGISDRLAKNRRFWRGVFPGLGG